jgi:hypothetical protein
VEQYTPPFWGLVLSSHSIHTCMDLQSIFLRKSSIFFMYWCIPWRMIFSIDHIFGVFCVAGALLSRLSVFFPLSLLLWTPSSLPYPPGLSSPTGLTEVTFPIRLSNLNDLSHLMLKMDHPTPLKPTGSKAGPLAPLQPPLHTGA